MDGNILYIWFMKKYLMSRPDILGGGIYGFIGAVMFVLYLCGIS